MFRVIQFLFLMHLYIVHVSRVYGIITNRSASYFQVSSCQHCFRSQSIGSGRQMLVTPCGGSDCVSIIKNTEIDENSVLPTQYYNYSQCGIVSSGLRSTRAIQLKMSTGVENTLRPGEYPWLVRIESHATAISRTVILCGGTLIHPQWVLTAAQCMFDIKTHQLSPANGVKIYMGHSNRLRTNKDEVIMQPAVYIVHPKFRINRISPITVHDLALIKLKSPVPLSRLISVACLPERSDKLNDGTRANTAGWGYTSPNSSAADQPRKATIRTAPRACQGFKLDSNLHICGRNNRGNNICNGDAGSGLMVRARNASDSRAKPDWRWHIFGVASHGRDECSTRINHDNAFSSVVADVDWIHEMMEKY